MQKNIRLNQTFKLAYRYHTILCLIFIFFMVATFSFFATRNTENTSAVTTTGFNAGNIMSDAIMADYNSMSKDEIQRFLTAKNPCNNRDYNYYLQLQKPGYTWHWSDGHFVCLSEERFGDGETIGSGQTAAEIIYQAAQDYRINPRVLIVLLQKEQSLITDPIPNNSDYRKATGFGCPDSGEGCSSKYYGFKNQVRLAANLFRTVLDGGWSNYPAYQTVYVQYHPNRNCGGSNVYIENRATSALYRYTPYQPNQAALNGGGDSCSAYGNRNFYSYYMEWFGNPHASINGEIINIPEGEYIFTSGAAANSRALGVAAGNKNGTNVQIVEYNSNDSRQKWQVKKTTDGYYQFIHAATGKALDVNGGYAENNTNIQLWERNDSCAQKWKIYSTGNDGLSFESACLGSMMVDLHGGDPHKSANIAIWIANNHPSQKWHMRVGRTIEDGSYNIKSSINTKKSIEIYGNYDYSGANIAIWSRHSGENQKWLLRYDESLDSYNITNAVTGKNLDLYGGGAYNGANINLWDKNNSACSQRWKIIPRDKNQYMILSSCSVGYALDVYGGDGNDGTNINVWEVHDNASEQWQFEVTQPLISDGAYSLLSESSNAQAIDIYGGYTHSGANVTSWSFHGGNSERWKIKYNSKTGDYTLTNPISNKNLDVYGAETYNGANVQIYDQNNSCAQRWYIVSAKESSYQLISTCDVKKALDVNGGLAWNGINIQLWSKNSTSAQRWSLAE